MLGAAGEKLLHLKRVQLQTVEAIDGIQIDWDGDQLAIHAGQHFMLVLPPFGETGEVVEDLSRVRVKNMRTVFMNQNARVIVMIVSVAADVGPSIDQQDLFAGAGGETLRQDAAGVTSANN